MGVTGITYIGALYLDKNKRKRNICAIFVILALLPLLVFKYDVFVCDTINSIIPSINLSGLNWAIPVGISFFTFQALGYMWDVYYGRIKAELNFSDYVLFCSFFPQTASGPISRYSELAPQIKQFHPFFYKQGVDGLKILLWGMFFKVVVADRLGLFVDSTYRFYEHYSGLTLLETSIYYSIQIYCDFAGYSMMAVGIGKILGFDLVNNFKRPYFADSVTNFWKRWHISLTRWLTSYIYIPLGGSRCSKLRQYWNIMLTFLVSGLWHGANWTFVIWGVMHGLFQIMEKSIGLDPKGKYGSLGIVSMRFLNPIRILLTFLLVNFAWIFFRMPSFTDAYFIINRIFIAPFDGKIHLPGDKYIFFSGLAVFVIKEIYDEYFIQKYTIPEIVKWCVYLLIFIMILSIGVLDSGQFIYVNF